VSDSHGVKADDAVKTLLSLLQQAATGVATEGVMSAWTRRKALVCTSEQYREAVARRLAENNYQVFVAEETRQAIETMRSNQLQIVVLEAQFDVGEQGAAFVVREINVLRASHRRRLFFVLLSPSLRTMDAHAAFLNNVNAVVNLADLDQLPDILEIALREFNDLYKEFNGALSLAPL
jgi:response regulator RpfG family c-di-GMP phosphodiesterase